MLFRSSDVFYALGNHYFKGSYQYEVQNYSKDKIIIPNLPSFKIRYQISINDKLLETSSFITEYFMKSMESSNFWNELQYKFETEYSNSVSYSCRVEDQLMNQSIISRFNDVQFVYLNEMCMSFSIYTESLKISIFIKIMNYFHSSLVFNHLQFEMPFVFNYYSRLAFKDNYKYIHSISYSLVSADKLVSKLLTILHSKNASSAKFLYDLEKSQSKRQYQSSKLRKKGKLDHTLILFNNENMDESKLSHLGNLLG